MTIGELCDRGTVSIQTGPFGSQLHAQDYRATGTPVIPTEAIGRRRILDVDLPRVDGGVVARLARHKLSPGDILFARRGAQATGLSAMIDSRHEGALCGTGAILLRVLDRHGVDPAFLSFVLSDAAAVAWLRNQAVGAVMPNLNADIIRRFALPLPVLADQQRISRILGALDEKIDLNRRTSETLEAMARALFKSWFVDFDPVRAKAAGRQPPGMDAETARLFPNEFVDSEHGPIPEGWTDAPLADWAHALSGGTPAKTDPLLWNGAVPWISPKVMTSIHADEADAFVTTAAIGNGTRLAPVGSTLVMVRGMGLHKEVRISQVRRQVAFNQDVKALVPKGIEPALLLFALLAGQSDLLGRVESSGHGTGKLPSEVLLAHRVVMPPAHVQQPLARVLASFSDRIATLAEESRTLGALRDHLLPALLAGDISVTPDSGGLSVHGDIA